MCTECTNIYEVIHAKLFYLNPLAVYLFSLLGVFLLRPVWDPPLLPILLLLSTEFPVFEQHLDLPGRLLLWWLRPSCRRPSSPPSQAGSIHCSRPSPTPWVPAPLPPSFLLVFIKLVYIVKGKYIWKQYSIWSSSVCEVCVSYHHLFIPLKFIYISIN